MSLEDKFLSYDFQDGKIFELVDDVLPAGKRALGGSATLPSSQLPAIPIADGHVV